MANELEVSLDLYFKKGDAPSYEIREFKKHTITGNNNLTGYVQEIGTSGTNLTKPTGLGTPRYLYLKNLDPANQVKYGDETTQAGYLAKSEFAFTGWCASQVKCVASSASLKVAYGMWDKT